MSVVRKESSTEGPIWSIHIASKSAVEETVPMIHTGKGPYCLGWALNPFSGILNHVDFARTIVVPERNDRYQVPLVGNIHTSGEIRAHEVREVLVTNPGYAVVPDDSGLDGGV
jgi:hypothetical protein